MDNPALGEINHVGGVLVAESDVGYLYRVYHFCFSFLFIIAGIAYSQVGGYIADGFPS